MKTLNEFEELNEGKKLTTVSEIVAELKSILKEADGYDIDPFVIGQLLDKIK